MGDVGNFFFGGSKQKQTGSNSYTQESQSTNQSQSNAVQASTSGSSQQQRAGNASYNQAYGPLSAAYTPVLGNTLAASTMMASLLGLPAPSFAYEQTPFTPGALLPPASETGSTAPALPTLGEVVESLATSEPTTPPPAPTPTPPPGSAPPPPATPPPATPPSSPPTVDPSVPDAIQANALGLINSSRNMTGIPAQGLSFLASGGPVQPGQPVVVGETQPEVFVPQTPGVVLPSAGGRGRRNADWRSWVMQRMSQRMGGAPLPGTSANPNPKTPMTVAPTATTPATAPVTTPAAPAAAPAATTATPASPSSGLENWADSAGMNFILDQGQKAISGASAANGVFNSGATGKALEEYGINLGKTYLNEYMGQLMNYGQLGLGAGSALANAGGVSVGQSAGGGSSSSVSGGLNSSSSSGQSTSSGSGSGSTSGSGNSKKGLLNSIPTPMPAG